MRALVCFITCLTRGTIASILRAGRPERSCATTSVASFDAVGDLFGEPLRLSDHPAGRIQQLAVGAPELAPGSAGLWSAPPARCPASRSFTLRLRSRSLAPASPAILVIFFIVRVSTRTPSPSKLESVG